MQDQYFDYYMENIQRSQMINQQNQIDQLIDLREASRVNSTGAIEDDDLGGELLLVNVYLTNRWFITLSIGFYRWTNPASFGASQYVDAEGYCGF